MSSSLNFRVPDISGVEETDSIQLSGLMIPLWLEYIVKEEKIEHVCIIDVTSDIELSLPYSIALNREEYKKISSPSRLLIDSLTKYSKSCNKRFMFVVIALTFEDLGHANLAIIDRKKKTIERFEPQGTEFSEDENIKLAFGDVDKNLKEILLKFLKGYKYKKAKEICPYPGPQYKQKKTGKGGGFCSSWSAFIMHLKILNPDLETKKIVECVLKYSPKKLSEIIRKYTRLIEIKVEDKVNFIQNGTRYGIMKKLSSKLKKIIVDYL